MSRCSIGTQSILDVRLAVGPDAAEIARLALQLGYPVTLEQITHRLNALLLRPNTFIAAAESSHSLLGWVAAERRLIVESGERAELVGLVVGENARRLGVGTSLVRAAERWAVTQGLTRISVKSDITRSESHPFYERIGYVRQKTQHSYAKQLAI